MTGFDRDPDRFEEARRKDAAGADDEGVVRDGFDPFRSFDLDL